MFYRFQVIGNPIEHSLSPWIHRRFMEIAKINGEYTKNKIEPNELEVKFAQIKEQGIDGFNVTLPHKQAIIPLLDDLDDTAEKMGAVNTVAYKKGKWIGYNTDGIGYLRSLERAYPDLFIEKEKKKVLIIGAGGASRAIFYALYNNGFQSIDLANRTVQSAEQIASLQDGITTNILTLHQAEQNVSSYDLIIQTTSVGMVPNEKQSVIEIANIKEFAVVSDIVYQPIETKLLQDAKKAGARIHFGHTMLLFQAQASFEIWTGIKPEIGDLDKQLKEILEGR